MPESHSTWEGTKMLLSKNQYRIILKDYQYNNKYKYSFTDSDTDINTYNNNNNNNINEYGKNKTYNKYNNNHIRYFVVYFCEKQTPIL